ncbi:hypothetical protein LKR43_09410 [Pusillimonas sp. MFBS29]|uniref:hypothetical protein n=1 Tax=Pusillimonas sp. MFBS29 TaxID=2886690 RepID=UPI001D101977|nr:hypothetical protein [Pusillimonas sp. MFBS29]MCC2596559.1 hypothetical protein [Pusillimonas sp. MFBS29]
MPEPQSSNVYYTADAVVMLLGVTPARLEDWRRLTEQVCGVLQYGPPYEYRDGEAVYPRQGFSEWCGKVPKVGGVPRIDKLVGAH